MLLIRFWGIIIDIIANIWSGIKLIYNKSPCNVGENRKLVRLILSPKHVHMMITSSNIFVNSSFTHYARTYNMVTVSDAQLNKLLNAGNILTACMLKWIKRDDFKHATKGQNSKYNNYDFSDKLTPLMRWVEKEYVFLHGSRKDVVYRKMSLPHVHIYIYSPLE